MLIAIIPLLLVLFFSVDEVLEDSKILNDVEDLQELSQLSIKISAYVHEMQKERGATGLFMGSDGTEFQQVLADQRALTDTKRDDLNKFLEKFDTDKFGPEFAVTFDGAFDLYAQLGTHRNNADAQSISDRQGIDFYTTHNALMLDVIHFISKTSSNAEISTIISSYVSFLEGKEKAGAERALMSNIFAADKFGPGDFNYFSSLVTSQDTYFDSFYWYASENQIDFFELKQSDPVFVEVQRIRDIAYDKFDEESLGNVDAGHWFRSMTNKINLMKDVEDRISDDLNIKALELKNEARRDLILSLILAIGSLVVTLILSFVLTRSIIGPIMQLHKATKYVESGNFGTRVDIKTNDELEALGKAFNKTTEVLEGIEEERKQLDRAKTEFLSITSHELRSPMTPMKAQAQMLLKGYFGKLNKKQQESVNTILRNTTRLDTLINDMLELSRIEAARLKFVFKKTDLTESVKSLVNEMKGFMPEKKIKLTANIGKLPVIEVDPDRVGQILRNLVNNAIKFTPEKGSIEVDVEGKIDHILFSVKDNGIGIKEGEESHIFEPFYQIEHAMQRKVGGTGLGLAICKGIVESQHGKIWIESKEGKGTTFYFTVPFEPVKEIKPIKSFFAKHVDIEKPLEDKFKELLGPIGILEFEGLKERRIKREGTIK